MPGLQLQRLKLGLGPAGGGGARPSLSLDFAGTGLLDSRITFSRASTATYVNSSGLVATATSGSPRFGYDPATLAPLGLLIEEARTNLFFPSDLSSQGSTVGVGLPVSGQTDPSGTTGALSVLADGTNTTHFFATPMVGNISVVSGTTYAMSCYVKAGTGNRIQLSPSGATGFSGSSTVYANFLLSGAGSVTAVGAGVVAATIQQCANGYYRITIVAAATANGSSQAMVLSYITSGTDARSPTTTANYSIIFAYGQFEATTANYPGPTSYIPTVSGTVTRAADVASMTGANFSSWFNQAAGTFVVSATVPSSDQLGSVLDANVGATAGANNHLLVKINAAGNAAGKRWAGQTAVTSTAQSLIVTSGDTATGTSKIAYAYAANDFAFVADGVLVGSDAAGSLPSPDTLWIGNRDSALHINGHIGSIQYYNRRLSNAQLQALTA